MKAFISIIVPCYDQAQYLDDCLQSILDQTYTNWECIIVNDGSPDNTERIADEWLQKDSRFKYIKKINGGLSSARNAGLHIASGDFIQFLDSDDLLAPTKLFESITLFQQNNSLDIVITNFYMFDGLNSQKNVSFSRLSTIDFNFNTIVNDWDINFTIPIHCAIFKKSAIGSLQFNENLKAKEDWLFWIQLFKKSPKVSFINQELAGYRRHQMSMTQSTLYMQNSQEIAIQYIKNELSIAQYEIFLLKRLEHYKKGYIQKSNQYSNLKNSLTYRFASKIKFIVAKTGLLPIIKKILLKLRK